MKVSEKLYAFLWSDPDTNNCNTYLIDGGLKILVDPGHQHLFARVRDEMEKISIFLDDIDIVILTHGHPDHIESVKNFSGLNTLTALSEIEAFFISEIEPGYGSALGVPEFKPEILLRDGIMEVGDTTIRIIHTPGHSPGSLCLYLQDQKALITGDAVFYQGIGRTDLSGGNGTELKKSIKNLAKLDSELLLPGHGNIIRGKDAIQKNFEEIEKTWFGYLQ